MAELVVAGSGPQALTLCCLLLQKRPQWRRRLRVLDPSGTWLERWNTQMRRYEIPCLRSPSPHHPHPNPHALRRFAQERQRGAELEGLYGLPHTELFADFCRSVVDDFQLADRVQAVAVEGIRLAPSGDDAMELDLSDGSVLAPRRLVIATGAEAPVLPDWVQAIEDPYPADALRHSQSLDLGACRGLAGQHLVIVGGGLTSAHLALGAIRRGARVSLFCRRRLRRKAFDADPGWLGPRYLKDFRAEPCWHRRRLQVLAARDGGSITPELASRLQQAQAAGALQLDEGCEIASARWCQGQWLLHCRDGSQHRADRLWLATGHRLGVGHHPLLRQLQQQRPQALIEDWPVLSGDLRWPGTQVHVMGGLSVLQLGPAARNLFGGREAAQRICRAALKS
jgi:cation diffusion facilitator CzcD-associated flavoprotein CzcO